MSTMSTVRGARPRRVVGAVGFLVSVLAVIAFAVHGVGPLSPAVAQDPGVPVVHMSKTFLPRDPQPAPGEVLTYTVVLVNDTPYQATNYRVFGTIPTGFVDKRWDCTATGPGSVCGVENGLNNLDDVVDVGPNGGRIVYNVRGRVDPDLSVGFTQVVTLVAPAGQSCEPQYDPINNPDLVPILGPILPSIEPHLNPPPTPTPTPEPAPTPDAVPAAPDQPSERDRPSAPAAEPAAPSSGSSSSDAPAGVASPGQRRVPLPEQTGYVPPTSPPAATPSPSPSLPPQQPSPSPSLPPPGAPEGAICVVNNDVVPRLPTPTTPPGLPVTGVSLLVLGVLGAASVAAGAALLWWASARRRLRRANAGHEQ